MTGSIVRTHATLKALSRDTRNKLIRERQRGQATHAAMPPKIEAPLLRKSKFSPVQSQRRAHMHLHM